MTVKQINFRLGEATLEMIDSLAELYGSKTNAIVVAIERLHMATKNAGSFDKLAQQMKLAERREYILGTLRASYSKAFEHWYEVENSFTGYSVDAVKNKLWAINDSNPINEVNHLAVEIVRYLSSQKI